LKFSEFKLSPELFSGLDAMGFEEATPIQEQAIPFVLEGHDLIACAQTGTGKTAAFILPLLHSILESKSKGVKAIIIAPTRELAMQIDQQLEGFSYFVPISSIPIYGGGDGMTWDQQKSALIKGADVIISTPGRLIAHLKFGYVKFDSLKFLILDEADRMLDMGFFDDIMTIVDHIPEKRQTLMFSATMPDKIRTLAKKLLHNPKRIDIAISKPAEGIIQGAYLVYDNQKLDLISDLLKDKEMKSILIFSSTKVNVKNIGKQLKNAGFNSAAIHSDLLQKEREDVMLRFRNRKIQILVATNIVSRGIDIDGIDLVINYNVPQDAEDYVHRIGRTARADSSGVALTFVNDNEQEAFASIEKMLETVIYKIPLPEHLGKGPEYNPNQKKNRNSGRGANKGKRKFSNRKKNFTKGKPKNFNKKKD